MKPTKQKLISLLKEHGSGAAVARELNVASTSISNWCKEYEIKLQHKETITKEQLIEAISKHKTKREASKFLGISEKNLNGYLKRRGIKEINTNSEWYEFLENEPKIGETIKIKGYGEKHYTQYDRWFYTNWKPI